MSLLNLRDPAAGRSRGALGQCRHRQHHPRRVSRRNQWHLHRQRGGGRHWRHGRRLPLRLPAPGRGWRDCCPGDQPNYPQLLEQSRADDAPRFNRWLCPRFGCPSLPGQSGTNPSAQQRRWHDFCLQQQWRRSPGLAQARAGGQHHHQLPFNRWGQLDTATKPQHDNERHDLCGLGRYLPRQWAALYCGF